MKPGRGQSVNRSAMSARLYSTVRSGFLGSPLLPRRPPGLRPCCSQLPLFWFCVFVFRTVLFS